MRKAHKKLLLEIFDSLHEAHREIKKLMTRGSHEEALALMAQCRTAACVGVETIGVLCRLLSCLDAFASGKILLLSGRGMGQQVVW